ncbi:MAG TPA: FAD:protein FMN transferase [Thermomicrobiales bacterium]|nr:FAD:protein FMN transferase [Thermomicrobiales bacterium]
MMDMPTPTAPAVEAPAAARFRALGSQIEVLATEPAELALVVGHVRACLAEIDRTFSRFRADSELARLEGLPGLRQPASPLFLELLDLALRVAAATDGWFDPTVRDALEAAGYDRSIERLEAEGPGPARLAAPAGRWRAVAYDRDRGWVAIPAGVRLDFGGIGKGFAVDYALRTLPAGRGGVLLNAGGDLAVRGRAPAGGWLCAVAAGPGDPAAATVALHAGALATSGLGRRQWSRDGRRLHHLIDPRSGRPGTSPWRYVTVAARDCLAAEVAAKVAWLRGAAGPDWLAALGLPGRFAGRDGNVVTVGAWPASD